MIDENRFNQFGFPRTGEIQGITIHETGNYDMDAEQLERYMNEEMKTSQGTHYFVDWNGVRQVIPNDWAVYHTGKGKDFACKHCIAIEICDNLQNDLFEQAVANAIALIKSLQSEYNIIDDMISFHCDWNNTYCPHTLLDTYKSSRNFVYQRIKED